MLATATTQCLMCQKKDSVSNLIIEQGKKLPLIYGKIMIYLEKDAFKKMCNWISQPHCPGIA